MRVDDCQMVVEDRFFAVEKSVPHSNNDAPSGGETFIDPLELEALGLILEYSLKVHTPHQFYCWTQGMLQNLIRHELLICAQRKGESGGFHADSFSTSSIQPALINGLFGQDTSLVPNLMKAWEENRFQPVIRDIRRDSSIPDSALVRELNHINANEILVHGTHDRFGKTVSFFIFACRSGSNSSRQVHLARLVVPIIYGAWVHTQLVRPATLENAHVASVGHEILTPRELEILGWIYRGKSNIEIGMILGLSPFTVKNHVQKILRRLNVLNRAQAVGKALALRIFEDTAQH